MIKTTVLGFSDNGVYVKVENTFAVAYVDYNTSSSECIEVQEEDTEECFGYYPLGVFEKEKLSEFFEQLLDR